jgi:hypothetical protein
MARQDFRFARVRSGQSRLGPSLSCRGTLLSQVRVHFTCETPFFGFEEEGGRHPGPVGRRSLWFLPAVYRHGPERRMSKWAVM